MSTEQVVDYGSIALYGVALCWQSATSFLLWVLLDWWSAKSFSPLPWGPFGSLPFWIRFLVVYALNTQVGRFQILLQTVSERLDGDLSPDRKRPSWTPPGWVFALMWPFFVFGTRAYAMVAVAERAGGFANPVTLAMMVHFGIGSLWSHASRVEQQLGVSMLLLYALFGTKALTAYLAYRIDAKAGIALACTLSWLGAASALGTATWRLNPDPATGRLLPLVPRKARA